METYFEKGDGVAAFQTCTGKGKPAAAPTVGPDKLLFSASSGSIYKVTRELKKEQNSLYNCLCSILHDVQFVNEMRALYPGVPLLANLRCGLWYTEAPDATCYFKSTDVSRIPCNYTRALGIQLH